MLQHVVFQHVVLELEPCVGSQTQTANSSSASVIFCFHRTSLTCLLMRWITLLLKFWQLLSWCSLQVCWREQCRAIVVVPSCKAQLVWKVCRTPQDILVQETSEPAKVPLTRVTNTTTRLQRSSNLKMNPTNFVLKTHRLKQIYLRQSPKPKKAYVHHRAVSVFQWYIIVSNSTWKPRLQVTGHLPPRDNK